MISVIIPCLNHYKVTVKCLQYLAKFTNLKEIELILVDDGSTDDTRYIWSKLPEMLPDIGRIIELRNEKNMGFPYSVNRGILNASGEYIAIFNNDMLVGPAWLTPLIRALTANPNYGMVTGTLVEPKVCSDDQFLSTIKVWPSPYSLNSTKIKLWEKDGPWLFRKEVFEIVGPFDEDYLYTQYEDTDMLLRMAIQGFKHGRVVNSYTYHYSRLTQDGDLKKIATIDYPRINREHFIAKWGTAEIDYQVAYETQGRRVSQ